MDERYGENGVVNGTGMDGSAGMPSHTSLIRPKPPTGTAFNRRTVMAMVLTFGALIMFGIMYAFTPQQQATQAVAGENLQPEEGVGQIYTQTPDMLNNLPSTYQESNRYQPMPSMPTYGNDYPYGNDYIYPGGTESESFLLSQSGLLSRSLSGSDGDRPQLTQEEKEALEARRSQIRFGNVQTSASSKEKTESGNGNMETELLKEVLAIQANMTEEGQTTVKSGQALKEEFFKKDHGTAFYATSALQAPVSRYEVKAGTIIPAVLITGINSDLPGYLVAQVRENVYDTVSGRHLLIPQGSRLIGVYDSKLEYGQQRVMVVWTRIIYPNGYSLNLENMPGVDGSGYSGFKDKVNNHYGKLFAAAFLTSVLSAGVKYATDSNKDQSGYDDALGEAMAENIANLGTQLVEKNLNVQPTIEIRPGYRFNVFVHKDFVLKPYSSL